MEFHDPFESCPYNIFHRIRRSRMQFHITICAQNHRHVKGLVQCPFDARHIIKQIEFEHHKSTCPARELVIDYAIYDPAALENSKILPIDVNPVARWDEKWDDDPDVKTYNPIEYIKDKPIVYPLIGVSKAKRKIHRLQERIRYRRVMENEAGNRGGIMSQDQFHTSRMSTSSGRNSNISVIHEIGDSTDEGEKPLRPPSRFLIPHLIDISIENYQRRTSQSSICMDPEISLSSEIDQSSNDSSCSVAASSSSLKTSVSKKSSEDPRVFEKSSRVSDKNAPNNSDHEINFVHDQDSIVSSKDNYQFHQHQSKNQEKLSSPYANSIISSKDDYQFNQYQSKDQEKFSSPCANSIASSTNDRFNQHQSKDQEKFHTSDANSTFSSWDNYQFVQHQPKDQENLSTSDAISNVSSWKSYQFLQYKPRNPENLSNSDRDSIASSKDDYQIHQYKYNLQEKCSISDTISIISGKGKYQFYQRPSKNQEKLSITDTDSIASSRYEYQLTRTLIRTSSEISLSSSMSENSEIDSVLSCEEGEEEQLIDVTSKTVEETAKDDEDNEEFLVTDTVYNVSNESQFITTLTNGNLDVSPSSSEESENLNQSFSNGIGQTRKHSINSIETNSIANVSIFDKLSRTIEELAIDNEDYKIKSQSLDQEIKSLKKLQTENKFIQTSASVNLKKGKLFRRCGANFLNLKS